MASSHARIGTQPTLNFRWFVPEGMPADYPPVLQQMWIDINMATGAETKEWRDVPLVRGA